MKKVIQHRPRIEGAIATPGDKSTSHRAALLNSIAEGTAHVSNFCVGDDRASMLRVLRGLGVRITRHNACPVSGADECFKVEGRGLDGLVEPTNVLSAGNSGTTTRLVSGLLAGQSFMSVLTGDGSLRRRPMSRVVKPLTQMGAKIMGRSKDTLLPLAIRGGDLKGINYTVPMASAQVKSCVLIAGLYAQGTTTVTEPTLSRDHTERMLRYMGANLKSSGLSHSISRSKLIAKDIAVPGDTSSAAFWLVAGAVHPNARITLRNIGINPTRTGVIKVLESMGARIRMQNVRESGPETVADIVVETSELHGTEIRGEIIPHVIDELPVLSLAAALAKGKTVIADAEELRVKESDRINATAVGLNALGARVEEQGDGMVIYGGAKLKGAAVKSYGDHRIAMTMGIAGVIATGRTTIDGAEAASVSYPLFWDTLQSLTMGGLQ
ncbi:MAG: 3-phosphoshikimate 1-carboxyvinyltransferase [SAR202 cluster bacterium]|nr:3-phosphoshikimate 1-carboxyvinyltransferase [SAR202 cluster bacterium]